MANNPNAIDNLKPCKPGETHNPNGRPKKIYTILKEKGYSKDDIKTALNELAFYTINELNEIIDDEKKPIITRIIAKNMIKAYKDGQWYLIENMMSYIVDKPTQKNENRNFNQNGKIEVCIESVDTEVKFKDT
jgi:hypothetical protein